MGFPCGSSKYPVRKSGSEWRKILSPPAFMCLRQGGTEPPGSSILCKQHPTTGYFACAGCGLPLYSTNAKQPDSDWPTWDRCFFSEDGEKGPRCNVATSQGVLATEILCAGCGGHLGHVFYGEHCTSTNERH